MAAAMDDDERQVKVVVALTVVKCVEILTENVEKRVNIEKTTSDNVENILIAALLDDDDDDRSPPPPPKRRVPSGHVDRLTLDDFRRHFHMERTTIQKLAEMLGPNAFWKKKTKTTKGPGRPSVDPRQVILTSVWLLANQESYHCVARRFGVSKGQLFKDVMLFCRVMYDQCHAFLSWPESEDDMAAVAEDFRAVAGCSGVAGALGAIRIPIKTPAHDDDDGGSYFDHRRGFSSVFLQGTVNWRTTFLDVFAGWPGGDGNTQARVWRQSPLYAKLKSGKLKLMEFNHLVASAAYPLDTFLLTPYDHCEDLTDLQANFNAKHGLMLSAISTAFSKLRARFQRLRCLDMNRLDMIPKVIVTTCCLHNLCVFLEDPVSPDDARDEEEEEDHQQDAAEAGDLALTEPLDAVVKRDYLATMLTGVGELT